MTTIGLDGCKKGWFFFREDGANIDFGIVTDLRSFVEAIPQGSVALIDIPIGLRSKNEGERQCDLTARQALKPFRASSVFPAPCRQAVYASSYEESARINRSVLGKGLSKQSWAIAPKIREVDSILRSLPLGRRSIVREVHPEVCFWGLAGRPMRHPKKSQEGFEERMAVLNQIQPKSLELAGAASLTYGGKDAQRDDILDALVAMICATKIEACVTFPETPETDEEGLPMEMVYLPAAALTSFMSA